MRDGVSGVFVVWVGQGGMRRLAVTPNGYFRVENCRLRNGFERGIRIEKSVAKASKTLSPKAVASALCLGLGTA